MTYKSNINLVQQGRIEYIDNLRGFAILLVVLSHVFSFCFGHVTSTICDWFTIFYMPLFFYISGFVLYKESFDWNLNNTKFFLLKKAKVLLVPTIFFFSLFEFCIGHHWQESLFHTSKGGYWFTFAIFYYFLIYSVLRCLFKIAGVKHKLQDILLFILAIFLFFLPLMLQKISRIDQEYDPFSLLKLKLFVFFFMGTMVRKYYNKFCLILDNPYYVTLIVVISILGYIASKTIPIFQTSVLTIIKPLVLAPACIFTCVGWFRKHEAQLSQKTRLGRLVQFVGRRTLDVYMLHYFVLPRHLDYIGEWFNINSMPFLYFFTGLIVSIFVLCFSMALSSLIRLSPVFAHWLFGEKKNY